jgi:hypothetical protein
LIGATGGYDDDSYEMIRQAATAENCQKVFWVRPDMTKGGPPPGGPPPPPSYAKEVAERTKNKLDELRSGGAEEGDLVFF